MTILSWEAFMDNTTNIFFYGYFPYNVAVRYDGVHYLLQISTYESKWKTVRMLTIEEWNALNIDIHCCKDVVSLLEKPAVIAS